MPHATCSAKTKTGAPCQARPLANSLYCFAHEPTLAGKRAEWRRKGGRKSKRRERQGQAAALQTPEEIKVFLGRMIESVRNGEIAPTEANAIARLCNLQLKAIEHTEFAERLRTVERLVKG